MYIPNFQDCTDGSGDTSSLVLQLLQSRIAEWNSAVVAAEAAAKFAANASAVEWDEAVAASEWDEAVNAKWSSATFAAAADEEDAVAE